MSSVSKPQGADLAKVNYSFLRQAEPKADLHVDGDGRLHALKNSNSIFQSWFGGAAVPNPKRAAQAKINAQVWGHLIPRIKELQAKETLSVQDSSEIQEMQSEFELVRDEVEQFRKDRPEYVERFEKLLKKIDKRLEQQACRYVKQTPPTEDEKRMEEIRDELHKIKELVAEGTQKNDEETPQPNAPKPKPAPAKDEGSSEGFDIGGMCSAAVDAGSAAFSTALYVGAGVASGALQAGLFPLQVTKDVVGTLLAPNLVQRAFGISNFQKGWDEFWKSEVFLPELQGGKEGVAYTGPLEVEEEIPELQETVGLDERHCAAVREEENFVPIHIMRPRAVITTSLEGKTWEKNPLWNRVKTCGAEWAVGGAKMAFWALAAYYLLGRYGNEHGKCEGECDLEQPSFQGAVSEHWHQLQTVRRDSAKCDSLLKRNQTEPELLDGDLARAWQRNSCPNSAVMESKQLVCDSLKQENSRVVQQLNREFSNYWQENDCDNQLGSVFNNPCDDTRGMYQAKLARWQKQFDETMEQGSCYTLDKCERSVKENQVAKERFQKSIAEDWGRHYCDDPQAKPIWSELWADMKKNPWKYPMNFAKTVDWVGTEAADKLSGLKEPGKVVLRGVVKMGQTLTEDLVWTFHGVEYLALAGLAGSSILNMRTTKSYVGWLASATTAAAALTAFCALDSLNNQAVATYVELSGRVVDWTQALLV